MNATLLLYWVTRPSATTSLKFSLCQRNFKLVARVPTLPRQCHSRVALHITVQRQKFAKMYRGNRQFTKAIYTGDFITWWTRNSSAHLLVERSSSKLHRSSTFSMVKLDIAGHLHIVRNNCKQATAHTISIIHILDASNTV
eukprot:6200334-Pleurochrysis_carterae.AAC.2